MALARLALKNLQQRAVSSTSSSFLSRDANQRRSYEFLRAFSTASAEKSETREISVSETEGGKKSKLSPRRRRRRNIYRDFVPALWEYFPSGLGDALLQATENVNRVMENLPPYDQKGVWIKEQDECYKLRYEVPGLSKEDLKIKVEDGMLTIKGEHKEQGSEADEEYYNVNSSVVLPDDAKLDEINAEMKNGVLNISIPRTQRSNKDVKEIQVN